MVRKASPRVQGDCHIRRSLGWGRAIEVVEVVERAGASWRRLRLRAEELGARW